MNKISGNRVNAEEASWVVIGVIVKAHGISGEVKVFPLTDMLDRFAQLSSVCLRTKNDIMLRYTVTNVRNQVSLICLKFQEVTTRDQADELKGAELVVLKSDIYPLPEGKFYVFDVIGLTVINEQGEVKGKVTNVYSQSAYDIYAVDWNGKEILIPAVQEYIRKIDIEHGELHINEQEGLFE